MIDRKRFTEKLKKIRMVCDCLLFEISSSFTLEDIKNCLGIINQFNFKEVISETSLRSLEYLNNLNGLKINSIILRLDKDLLSMLEEDNYKFHQKIKKICKLHLQICNWDDLDILKRLEFISNSLQCKDIIISIRNVRHIKLPFVLNAIPIIDDYYKKKRFFITLRNINKLYFKDKIPLDNIKLLEIEPSNTCNLSCPFCHVGMKERKVLAPMSFDLFKMIIDQFPRIPNSVNMWGRGEPFLNDNFFIMVKYLKEKGNPFITVSTNGHFLTKKNIARLIESRLDNIIISLDSVKKKTYETLRKGGDFDLLLGNLKTLSKIKKRLLAKPEVSLQFIITKRNEDEISLMRKLTDSMGFRAEFKSLSSEDPKLLPINKKFRRYEWLCNSNLKSINFCPSPWERMAISCDGKVTICCKALDSKLFDEGNENLVLGDLLKNNLEEIWNGRKYRSLRKQMMVDKHKIGCPARCPNPDFSLTSKIIDNKSK